MKKYLEHENFIIVCHLWVLLKDFLFEDYRNSFRASNGPSGLDRLLVHDRDPQMVFSQRRLLKHLTESIYYYISAQIQDLHVIDWGGGELSAKRSPMPDMTMSGEWERVPVEE